MSAKEASEALSVFNDMLYGLKHEGIDLRLDEINGAEYTLDDNLHLFIPPTFSWVETLDQFSYQGTWDASANSPSLASGSGTDGYVYKVATAGSTSLDGTSNWRAGNYAVFGRFDSFTETNKGLLWAQSQDTRAYEGGISAMLAERLADEFGYQPTPLIRSDARTCIRALFNHCAPPRRSNLFDRGLVNLPLGNRLGEEDLS